jgi:hypothetical protein
MTPDQTPIPSRVALESQDRRAERLLHQATFLCGALFGIIFVFPDPVETGRVSTCLQM